MFLSIQRILSLIVWHLHWLWLQDGGWLKQSRRGKGWANSNGKFFSCLASALTTSVDFGLFTHLVKNILISYLHWALRVNWFNFRSQGQRLVSLWPHSSTQFLWTWQNFFQIFIQNDSGEIWTQLFNGSWRKLWCRVSGFCTQCCSLPHCHGLKGTFIFIYNQNNKVVTFWIRTNIRINLCASL